MIKKFLLVSFFTASIALSNAQSIILSKNEANSFAIVTNKQATTLVTDENDHWLVQKAASLFQDDIEKVSGKKPEITHAIPASAKNLVIIGSLEQSAIIKQLVQQNKLKVDSVMGKWDGYSLQVVNNPFPNISSALVVVGNDRRGTAYGVFELSEQMGVSPWYWWADVPVKKKSEVFVKQGPL